jgi:hypothetical protein
VYNGFQALIYLLSMLAPAALAAALFCRKRHCEGNTKVIFHLFMPCTVAYNVTMCAVKLRRIAFKFSYAARII